MVSLLVLCLLALVGFVGTRAFRGWEQEKQLNNPPALDYCEVLTTIDTEEAQEKMTSAYRHLGSKLQASRKERRRGKKLFQRGMVCRYFQTTDRQPTLIPCIWTSPDVTAAVKQQLKMEFGGNVHFQQVQDPLAPAFDEAFPGKRSA